MLMKNSILVTMSMMQRYKMHNYLPCLGLQNRVGVTHDKNLKNSQIAKPLKKQPLCILVIRSVQNSTTANNT